MIVVLDSLRSAHNVGSIFRTSDAFGINKIFLCGTTPGPIDRFGRAVPRLTKVALGAENTVTWERQPQIGLVIERLKKDGFWIVALEQHRRAKALNAVALSRDKFERCALILGQETVGLSSRLLALVDQIIEIPQSGSKESLNVSVAYGVAVFWLKHARPKKR